MIEKQEWNKYYTFFTFIPSKPVVYIPKEGLITVNVVIYSGKIYFFNYRTIPIFNSTLLRSLSTTKGYTMMMMLN